MPRIQQRTSARSWVGEPQLAERDVHVWIVGERARTLGASTDGRLGGRGRSHTVLRLLLGAYLRVDPTSLRFERGEHGKPRLAGGKQGAGRTEQLHFNLSHSGGMTAVAISRCPVGIDVELPGRQRDYLALARRAFGDSTAARLRSLARDDREREFLRLWVRHEAALKCRGGRLSFAGSERAGATPWLAEIELPGAAIAALASSRRPAAIRLATAP